MLISREVIYYVNKKEQCRSINSYVIENYVDEVN
jgi:hypothetical protein